MKPLTSLKIAVLVGVLASGLVLSVHRAAAAAANQMYVSPSSTSVQNGSTVTVAVRINPDAAINGAQFTLNFDPSLLKFSSIDTSSSAFTTALQQTSTSSSVTVGRGLLGSTVSSDSLIANITLQGLADSGTSALTLTNANATYASPPSYANPSVVGGSVSLTAKPVSTSGGTSGTTSPPKTSTPKTTTTTSTGSGSQTSTAAGGSTNTVPPIVTQAGSNAGVVDSQYTVASINLQTSIPTQVYIKYGVDQSLSLQTPLSSVGTTHSVALDPSMLLPGQTYYYQVVVRDTAGNQTMTQVKTFSTKGFTVRFQVINAKGHKMANTKVELHSTPLTTTTDADGVATFNNVSPGQHHLIYTAGSHQFSQAITVYNDVQTDAAGHQTAAPQTLAVQFATSPSDAPLFVGIALVGVVVLFLAYYALRNRPHGSLGIPLQAAASISPVSTSGKLTEHHDSNAAVSIENAHGVGAPHPGSVIAPVAHSDGKKDK